MREIERQFLCRLPSEEALRNPDARIEMLQSYVAVGDPSVRIRVSDGTYVLGVKAGKGLVRDEVEVEVDVERGEKLLAIAGDTYVRKTRYVVGRWEIDVFGGKLEGLIIGEVELHEANEPLPPCPAGVDVVRELTGQERFTNQHLASLSEEACADLLRELRDELSDPG